MEMEPKAEIGSQFRNTGASKKSLPMTEVALTNQHDPYGEVTELCILNASL